MNLYGMYVKQRSVFPLFAYSNNGGNKAQVLVARGLFERPLTNMHAA